VTEALASLAPESPLRTDLEWRLQRLQRKLLVRAQGYRQTRE